MQPNLVCNCGRAKRFMGEFITESPAEVYNLPNPKCTICGTYLKYYPLRRKK